MNSVAPAIIVDQIALRETVGGISVRNRFTEVDHEVKALDASNLILRETARRGGGEYLCPEPHFGMNGFMWGTAVKRPILLDALRNVSLNNDKRRQT